MIVCYQKETLNVEMHVQYYSTLMLGNHLQAAPKHPMTELFLGRRTLDIFGLNATKSFKIVAERLLGNIKVENTLTERE